MSFGLLCLLLCLSTGLAAEAVREEKRSLYQFFHNKVDQNKDGLVTPEELNMFVYLMDPSEDGVHPARVTRPVFDKIDVNHDLIITWKEFRAKYGWAEGPMDANSPQEIHLSMTNDPSQMLVSWAQATWSALPSVQFGVSSGVYTQTVVGTSHNYSIDAVWFSMALNEVLLTGLSPSTTYYYICGSADQGWSTEFFFLSAPALDGPVPARVSWAMYGDMGTDIPNGAEVTQMLITEHAADPLNLVLHVGDLAYAGVSSSGEWEPTWDAWMNQIQPIAAFMPYQTTVGNHEKYYNYTAFINRFDMPGTQTGGMGNFWWSFDYGNVHVVSVSTENDQTPGSPQHTWIDQDMAKARGRGVEWLVVGAHRPFYSSDASEWSDHQPGSEMLTNLEPLFTKYQVDLVMTGHMHCYERTYPTINGTVFAQPNQTYYVNPTAPLYIVQGTAGAMQFETWIDPQPAWSAVRMQNDYGFGRLDVETFSNGTSTMHYQFKSSGVVMDEFWISKQ